MKKQLIIATIACAVSGAAFAATTGDHTINLNVTPDPPTLTLTGNLLTGTTELDFDNLRVNGDIVREMGTIGMTATGYPNTHTGHCQLSATSDHEWTLVSGALDPIEYQIRTATPGPQYGANAYLQYGYANQDTDPNPAPLVEHAALFSIGTAGSPAGTCSLSAPLTITVGGLDTRPDVTAFTQFTDTIHFVASVL